jgi:hypothetical protein
MLGHKSYMYNELNRNDFRLVKLLAARMAALQCEILHFNLDAHPHYTAISYAWGDAEDTKKIQIEGFDVPITSSLHGALAALRKKGAPVYVWADALCIDQQNRDERMQQVQLMTSIYSKVDSVAIWLGPAEEDSAIAIEFLTQIAASAMEPETISQLIASRVGKRDFAATVALFERDYWERLWVVQEVLNAKSITVYCGDTHAPWSVYEQASHLFSCHRRDLEHYIPGGAHDGKGHTVSRRQLNYSQVLVRQGPGSLFKLGSFTQLGETPLLEVLRACRRKLTADPRDKLFGILGILPQDVRQDFKPDYNLSVKKVYTHIVDVLLWTTGRLDVICEAIYFPIHTSSANLPTWVPDWSHVPQTSALGLTYQFAASGRTAAKFKLLDGLNRLEISAIYLDTIQRHGIPVGTLCTLAD